jgi:hypothetical protein
MVTDKEESSTVQKIELHADQAVCMPRQMMERNSLAEIHSSFIERFPV